MLPSIAIQISEQKFTEDSVINAELGNLKYIKNCSYDIGYSTTELSACQLSLYLHGLCYFLILHYDGTLDWQHHHTIL